MPVPFVDEEPYRLDFFGKLNSYLRSLELELGGLYDNVRLDPMVEKTPPEPVENREAVPADVTGTTGRIIENPLLPNPRGGTIQTEAGAAPIPLTQSSTPIAGETLSVTPEPPVSQFERFYNTLFKPKLATGDPLVDRGSPFDPLSGRRMHGVSPSFAEQYRNDPLMQVTSQLKSRQAENVLRTAPVLGDMVMSMYRDIGGAIPEAGKKLAGLVGVDLPYNQGAIDKGGEAIKEATLVGDAGDIIDVYGKALPNDQAPDFLTEYPMVPYAVLLGIGEAFRFDADPVKPIPERITLSKAGLREFNAQLGIMIETFINNQPEAKRRSMRDVINKAIRSGSINEARTIAENILETGRPSSDVENVSLGIWRVQLAKMQVQQLERIERLAEAGDQDGLLVADRYLESLEAEKDIVERAMMRGAKEDAHALKSLQFTIEKDLWSPNHTTHILRKKLGRPLTNDEIKYNHDLANEGRQALEELNEAYTQAQQEMVELDKQDATKRLEAEVMRAKLDPEKGRRVQPKRVKGKASGVGSSPAEKAVLDEAVNIPQEEGPRPGVDIGVPVGTIKNKPTVHLPLSRPEGGFAEFEAVYLRAGDIPVDEAGNQIASKNFTNPKNPTDEPGVSIYRAWKDPKTGKYVLEGGGTSMLVGQDETVSRPFYEVEGETLADVGNSGEDVLKPGSVKVVREVPHSEIVFEQDPWLRLDGEELMGDDIPKWDIVDEKTFDPNSFNFAKPPADPSVRSGSKTLDQTTASQELFAHSKDKEVFPTDPTSLYDDADFDFIREARTPEPTKATDLETRSDDVIDRTREQKKDAKEPVPILEEEEFNPDDFDFATVDMRKEALGQLDRFEPGTPEYLWVVRKLIRSHIRAGHETIEAVVDAVQKDIEGIDEFTVYDAFNASNPAIQRKARTRAQDVELELGKQAKKMVQISKVMQGIDPTDPRHQTMESDEMIELRDLLQDWRTSMFSTVSNPKELARYLKKVDDLTDQITKGYRELDLTGKPIKKKPDEIVQLMERVKELQTEMRLDDRMALLEEQFRTGDFTVMSRPKREIPPHLRDKYNRYEQMLKKRRHLIRQQEGRSTLMNAAGFFRTMKATFDMSAVLRQGLILSVTRPRAFLEAFGKSLDATFSHDAMVDYDIGIRAQPEHLMREMAGLELTEVAAPDFMQREEDVGTDWFDRLSDWDKSGIIKNTYGRVVHMSERHMSTFLNSLRVAAFDEFVAKYPNAQEGELKAWADYINKSTGRGDLGSFKQAATTLSLLFFAPRFAVSRWQAPMVPLKNWKKNPRVAKEAAKDLGATVAFGMMTLGLAVASGHATSTRDPDDPDFGKIVFNDNTSIDLWGGGQQFARALAKLGNDAVRGAQSIYEGRDVFADKRFDDLLGYMARAITWKVNPMIPTGYGFLTGRDIFGKPQDKWLNTLGEQELLGYGMSEVVKRAEVGLRAMTPLFIESMLDGYQTGGWGAVAIGGVPEFFGAPVQVYERNKTPELKLNINKSLFNRDTGRSGRQTTGRSISR